MKHWTREGWPGPVRAAPSGVAWRLIGLMLLVPGAAAAQWSGVPVSVTGPAGEPGRSLLEGHLAPSVPDTLPGLWRDGGNPAGLARSSLLFSAVSVGSDPDDPLAERSGFQTGLRHVAGSRRLVQDPVRSTALSARMFGERTGSDWHAAGSFSYQRESASDVRWSAVAFPHEGSPYVWSDSTGGDWERDIVELEGGIGAVPGHLPGSSLGGLAFSARFGQGARRSDPRPLFRIRDLRVAPGLGIELGAWTLGGHAILEWIREEGEIGYFAGDDPFVYRMRGYGTFDRTQLVRSVRTREGRRLGGGVQVERAGDRWHGTAAGELTLHSDSIRQGIARPEFAGGYDRTEVRGSLSLRRAGLGLGVVEVRSAGRHALGRGTDPVFVGVNTEDTRSQLSLRMATRRDSGGSRSASVPGGFVVHLQGLALDMAVSREAREDIAADTRWNASTARLGGQVELLARRSSIRRPANTGEQGERGRGHTIGGGHLELVVGSALLLGMDDAWEAGRPTRITEDLVRPDHLMTRQGGWEVGTRLRWIRTRSSGGPLQVEFDLVSRRGGSDEGALPGNLQAQGHRTSGGLTLSAFH